MKSSWSFVIVAGGKGLRLGGTPQSAPFAWRFPPLDLEALRCAQVLSTQVNSPKLVLVVPSGQEESSIDPF